MHRWLLVGLLSLASCTGDNPPLTLAPHVDVQRYAGRWYILANIPYFAEQGKVGSWFDIEFTAADRFKDVYWGRKGSLEAQPTSFTMSGYVKPGTGGAYWRESPFWPLYLSYLILYVDPEYRYALVGYPGRGYGWILSRTPTVSDAVYNRLLQRFADQSYDIKTFVRIPQMAGH